MGALIELTMPMIYAKLGRQHSSAIVIRVHQGGNVDLAVTDQFNQPFLAQNVYVVHAEPPDALRGKTDVCWPPRWLSHLMETP